LSLVQVCDLSNIDTLITDAEPPATLGKALEAANVRVVIAQVDSIDTIEAQA
jgi:DeoR/GlpR family transcriptional regulator of sugar metabolism